MQEPAHSQQRADVDGQGNAIVQFLRKDNRVDFGRRPYRRLSRYLRSRRIEPDADLLSPRSRSIPLVGGLGPDAYCVPLTPSRSIPLVGGLGPDAYCVPLTPWQMRIVSP